MRKIGEVTNFTVISFNPAAVCGGVFNLHAGSWRMTRSARRTLTGGQDESASWRELWKGLHGGSELIVITGAVPGGVLFPLETVALPPREQREALMMELPRQLLSPQNDPVLQFMPAASADSEEMVLLNVYSAERKALETILAPLRRARLRADDLVHPLLMVKPDDPAVILPEIAPGFCFRNRRFHRIGDGDGERIAAEAEWKKIFAEYFAFDSSGIDFQELLPMLIIARGIISGEFRNHRRELQLLPKEVHPVRFRGQLRLTALLVTALIAVSAYRFIHARWHDFQEYRRITAETENVKADTARMQKEITKVTKEQKDIAKALNYGGSSRRVLADMAAISGLLPQNVMLSDFRWNEKEISLTLLSENENLDLSEVFSPLRRRWQVSDVQHRNAPQSAITVINAKLVAAGENVGKNGKNGKNGRNGKGARNGRR